MNDKRIEIDDTIHNGSAPSLANQSEQCTEHASKNDGEAERNAEDYMNAYKVHTANQPNLVDLERKGSSFFPINCHPKIYFF